MFVKLRRKRVFLARLALISTCCLVGCQPAEKGAEHMESHEHFPPHWPYTIFQASDRLSELLQKSNAIPSGSGITPQQEMMDLIGWLPILAADSDLDRKTFDRIDQASLRIHKRWQALPLPLDLPTLANDPEVREMAVWLADIVQRERPTVGPIEKAPLAKE